MGNKKAIKTVLNAKPDIFSHNIECIERISKKVRPQADWQRSLGVLKDSIKFGLRTKTGLMVGFGETKIEVKETMNQIADLGVQIFTIGQYLQPTKKHLKVKEYVDKEKFDEYKDYGLSIGFKVVESGPLVRSSYHAENKQEWFSIMFKRVLTIAIILFFSAFISFIAINGTTEIYGKSEVQNITYKLPDSWTANESDKQFRLLELSLDDGSDFNVVLFANIQGTADQNIDRWINQFQIENSKIETIKDSLSSRNISTVELYGTYKVPNMVNRNAPKELRKDYGLLGGVIEFANSIYFVKAVGRDDLVKENKSNFDEFIYSISLK